MAILYGRTRILRPTLTAVLLACTVLPAAPLIVANPPSVYVGQIREGERAFVRALFALRNTGDSTLRITAVRPGCRCTVTEHDSVIPPGGMGRLLQVVDIHGFPDGPFESSVTVVSNAANQRQLLLPVRGIIRGFVEISARHLRIPIGGHGSLVRPTTVRSDRSDLRLTEAVFATDPQSQPPWRPLWVLPLSGALIPIRYDDREGLTYYELRLWVPYPLREKLPPGYCLIRVNHPRRREIVCHAVIQDLGDSPDRLSGSR